MKLSLITPTHPYHHCPPTHEPTDTLIPAQPLPVTSATFLPMHLFCWLLSLDPATLLPLPPSEWPIPTRPVTRARPLLNLHQTPPLSTPATVPPTVIKH
mmetsp:Transcript_20289/g.51922  ORF Transcript_20289/g.51922 Transcript_20289/m.51922 type:complete len:99 (-) Transcript_20289:2290-2586(-)